MKTFFIKKKKIRHKWFLIDVKDKILGRIANKIAIYLMGKHKPEFVSNIDVGDFIIVINTCKLKVSGNKNINKIYYTHSGYPGGIKKMNFLEMQRKFPCRLLQKAVKGMLPKGPLGYKMIKKLKIYSYNFHPHFAQKPQKLNFENV